MNERLDLFLLNSADQWDIIEAAYKLPVEQRHAFIVQKMKEKKAEYLGSTDKSVSELSIDLIKKGLKTKSFYKNKPKKDSNA